MLGLLGERMRLKSNRTVSHNPFLDTFIVSDILPRCTSSPGSHGSWVFTGRSNWYESKT
jgi:hypothetical protein